MARPPARERERSKRADMEWARRQHEIWFPRLFAYAATRLTDPDAAADIVQASFLATTQAGHRADFPPAVIRETVRRVRRARGLSDSPSSFQPGQAELDEDVLALRLAARLADAEIANALTMELHQVWLIVLDALSKIRDGQRSRAPATKP